MKLKKAFLFVLIIFVFSMKAQTKVASIFTDNMVLQQNTKVAVWGSDKPNTKIIVSASWGEKSTIKSDEKGQWKLFVKTEKAKKDASYTLEIKGSDTLILKNILLGEVWLASGQSNMEMPVKGFPGQPINNSNEFVLNSNNSQIRLFNVKKNPSLKVLDSVKGTWQEATPETVFKFSAVAYLYAKILQEKIDVPVGIICSSFGGTRIESWTDKATLENSKLELDLRVRTKTPKMLKNSPSVLYNGMIHPLIPYTIKGAIWYQGESNRGNSEQYSKLFDNMVTSWRQKWNIGDFPFYFVQIAPFIYKNKEESAYLREAQLKAMQTTKNTGMAVTLDIGAARFIHPSEKEKIAKRLAYWALVKDYGFKGVSFSGPVYKSIEIKEDKVLVKFDYAKNGVTSFGKELDNFTISGADKVFYPAKATIKRGKLTISSDKVKKPVAVRYGWTNYLKGGLYNLAGLPASSFRSDNWEKE